MLLSFAPFSTCLRVVFVIVPKKVDSSRELLSVAGRSGDLLMAIKISRKINVAVPVQFFFRALLLLDF